VDKLRCGVIGVGGMGANHAAFIEESEIGELVALCDVDKKILKEAAEKFNVEKTYTDFRSMVKDSSLDVVSVCTPHNLHASISIEAMKAKKHVLTEKPIATNLKDAEEMIKTAEENKVQLGVSEEHRYSGAVQLAKKWVEEGRLGKIYLCLCTERFGTWKPRDWGWRGKKEMIGGGSFIDQGHHAVDVLRYIMGDPYECCAYMTRPTEILEGEDVTLAIYKHSSGAISQVHAGWAPGPTQFEMSIYGLKGTIFANGIKASGVVSLFGPLPEKRGFSASMQQPIEIVGKAWRWSKHLAVKKFLNAVIKDEPFEYSGEEGKKNLAAILAAYESVEKGRSIKIRYD